MDVDQADTSRAMALTVNLSIVNSHCRVTEHLGHELELYFDTGTQVRRAGREAETSG